MRSTCAATAALLLLLLGACGVEDSATPDTAQAPDGRSSTPSEDPSSSPTPTPSPTPSPSTGATTPPSEGLEKFRVAGEVVQVGDCVVVRDDNATTWTVLGPAAAGLRIGARVQVTGAPDLVATGCGGPIVRAAVVTVVDRG